MDFLSSLVGHSGQVAALLFLCFSVGAKVPLLFNRRSLSPWDPDTNWIASVYYGSLYAFTQFWNDYEVHGLENVRQHNCLLIGYHSRTTLDLYYATSAIHPTSVISYIFFYVPGAHKFFSALGCVPSRSQNMKSSTDMFTEYVVSGDRPVFLLPGGAHEFSKSWDERYQLLWKETPGYARTLLDEGTGRPGAQTLYVPFFTHGAEDLYWTSRWWMDFSGWLVRACFRQVKAGNVLVTPFLPVLSMMAQGLLIAPRSVKLDLYFGKGISPKENESATAFSQRLQKHTQEHMDGIREKHALNPHPYTNKYLTHPLYGLYVVVQNVLLIGSMIVVNIVEIPIALIVGGIYKFFTSAKKGKVE